MSDDAERPPPGPNGIPVPEWDDVVLSGPATWAGQWRVAAPDLPDVRRQVLGAATLAGLEAGRARQFTLAVNEIVVNAIVHGDGSPTVEVSAAAPTGERDGDVTVTVTDTGSGFDHDMVPELPPPDHSNGRGLWLARRMCDDIEIDSSPRGTVVRLRATAAL